MLPKIRLAVRDWDYLTPLALGEVRSPRIELELDRVATLPDGIGVDTRYNATEASFSRHLSAVVAQDDRALAIPNFLMRGVRHQCIITHKDSPLKRIEDLADKRIGVTGWRDSGSVWTRAILRRAGVTTEDTYWYAGRLTEAHPVQDRLGEFHSPGRIEAVPGERPMMELLAEGWLDAVFTPFMPSGFFEPGSQFRQLLPDTRAAQAAYIRDVGYVPGIHLLTLDRSLARAYPWLPNELSDLIDESRRVWTEKRRRYAETTPFMLNEMLFAADTLPSGWDASGLETNRPMISDFLKEMHDQAILPRVLAVEEVFQPLGVEA